MDPRRGLTGRKRHHQKASTSDFGRRQSANSGFFSEVHARTADYPDDDTISLFSQGSVDTAHHSRYSTPPTDSDVEGPFSVPPPDRAPSSLASRHPPSNALIRLENTMLSTIGIAITEESDAQELDGINDALHAPKDMARAEALLRRVRSKIDKAAEQKKEASQTEAQLSSDLDEAKEKIASLEREKRDLSSDLNKATIRASALEGRETQLVADLNNAKGRIETLAASESRLKIDLQNTTKEVGTLREAKGKLEVQLEEEKTRAQRNEHVFKTTETQLKSDLERGKKDMDELRESKMKVVAERDALCKELDAYRAMIEKRMLGIYKMLLEGDEVLDAMGCKEM